MPPFAELFVPFADASEIEAKGRNLTLEWKSVGRNLVFRPRGASLTTLWFYTNVSTRPRRSPHDKKERSEVLTKRLSLGYGRRDFKRLVPLPGQDWHVTPELWLLVAPHMATVMGRGFKHGALWNAQFSLPGDKLAFLSAPLADFQRIADFHIHDNPDEWQEALQWMRWDDETRFWSLVTWQKGDVAEWKELLRALLHLAHHRHVSAHPSIGLSARWRIEVASTPKDVLLAPLEPSGSYLDGWNITPVLEELLALLHSYFVPQADLSRSRISSTYPLREILTGGTIVVEDGHLSQHEMLECLQTWRDFGHKSGQSAQVEECLRQLLT